MDEVAIERIFDVAAAIAQPKDTFTVCLVLGKQKLRIVLAVEIVVAEIPVRRGDHINTWGSNESQKRFGRFARRGPGVSEPECRQDVNQRRLGSTVVYGDPDQNVVRACLCVLDEDVEIAIVLKGSC